jgi:hypothetical protein
MKNRFGTEVLLKSVSNYPVSKGDVMGHAFHGNQHEAVSSSGKTASQLASAAANLAHDATRGGEINHRELSLRHEGLAIEHRDLAYSAKAEGKEPTSWAHEDAAADHDMAARFQGNALDGTDYSRRMAEQMSESAARSSERAS